MVVYNQHFYAAAHTANRLDAARVARGSQSVKEKLLGRRAFFFFKWNGHSQRCSPPAMTLNLQLARQDSHALSDFSQAEAAVAIEMCRLETGAVVLDDQSHVSQVPNQMHARGGGLGMFHDIVERLHSDPVNT